MVVRLKRRKEIIGTTVSFPVSLSVSLAFLHSFSLSTSLVSLSLNPVRIPTCNYSFS